MKKRKFLVGLLSACFLSALIGFDFQAKADYLGVLYNIGATANTINSINRGARSTMSTIEYSQRFTDRQQERKDLKRAEKSYNESAEAEYYKTIQETQALNREYSQLQYDNNL